MRCLKKQKVILAVLLLLLISLLAISSFMPITETVETFFRREKRIKRRKKLPRPRPRPRPRPSPLLGGILGRGRQISRELALRRQRGPPRRCQSLGTTFGAINTAQITKKNCDYYEKILQPSNNTKCTRRTMNDLPRKVARFNETCTKLNYPPIVYPKTAYKR